MYTSSSFKTHFLAGHIYNKKIRRCKHIFNYIKTDVRIKKGSHDCILLSNFLHPRRYYRNVYPYSLKLSEKNSSTAKKYKLIITIKIYLTVINN